jgi:hypothetical protein
MSTSPRAVRRPDYSSLFRQPTATPAGYAPDKLSLNNQSQFNRNSVHAVRIQAWAGVNSIRRHDLPGAHQLAFRIRFQQLTAPALSAVSTHSIESWREHQHLGVRTCFPNRPRRLQPTHSRHRDVHNDGVIVHHQNPLHAHPHSTSAISSPEQEEQKTRQRMGRSKSRATICDLVLTTRTCKLPPSLPKGPQRWQFVTLRWHNNIRGFLYFGVFPSQRIFNHVSLEPSTTVQPPSAIHPIVTLGPFAKIRMGD